MVIAAELLEETYRVPRAHIVQFHESSVFLLDGVVSFLAPALHATGVAVVIAIPAHREGIANRLAALGIDPEEATAAGRYVSFDAESLLTQLCPNGMPEPERFATSVRPLIERAGQGGRPVRAYGELASLLAKDNHSAALRLESLWNELLEEHDFSLLCAHSVALGDDTGATDPLRDICDLHSHVIPAESYAALPTEVDRLQAIVALQHKALRLEAEILDRLSIEQRLRAALASEQVTRLEAEAARSLHDAQMIETAHQLRNPLTSLSLNAQLSLRKLRRDREVDTARIEKSLLAIVDQTARMTVLLDQLRDVTLSSAESLSPSERHPRAS
jgi:hypothetical protein